MSVSGNDPELDLSDLADDLLDALVEFTGCIGNSLENICSYGLTIGETYVPFDPDPDDDECEDTVDGMVCSQAWVRVVSATAVNVQESFDAKDGCAAELGLTLEVGVLRCIEIAEEGAAPNANDVLAAALQTMVDMKAIHCAAMSCGGDEDEENDGPGWHSINSGQWVPDGPMGGQYGGIWTFDVVI